MPRSILSAALLLALGLGAAGYLVGGMHARGVEARRYVEVKGLAEREVPADLGVWALTITATGDALEPLQREIDEQARRLEAFFGERGFGDEETARGITNVEDAYATNRGGQRPPTRYVARADFTVRTTDVDRLRDALAASASLLAEGVLVQSKNAWRPVEYAFTGLNDLKPAMIEEATRNAREVAEKFAEDSDAEVGKIRYARQGLFSISDRDATTPEVKTVRVVSTVQFSLED